jgi:hypothetical protein
MENKDDARNAQKDEPGNVASGHPANNVITPQRQGIASTEARPTVDRGACDFTSQRHGESAQSEQAARHGAPEDGGTSGERGTRGSGMPVDSGAGQLADDRPGRDTPKGG